MLYKLPQTGCFTKIEIYSLTFLEAVSPKSRYQQECAPFESSREEGFISSFYFLVAFHALELHHFNLCLHLQMGFFSLFLCLLSYYKDIAHWTWVQPNPVWLPFSSVISAKIPFTKMVIVWGFSWVWHFEGHHSTYSRYKCYINISS